MLTQVLLLVTLVVSTVFSLEYRVGLDPSLCPNYPFCGDFPPIPVQRHSPRLYSTDLDLSYCPNYPYCHQGFIRQVPTVPLPSSAYPTGVDPSLCPNYPFCGDSPPFPVLRYSPRSYSADLDPSSCPNYPYCHQDVVRRIPPVHQVPPVPLPSFAYPTGVDPSLCPNYPFCGDSPPVLMLQNFPRRYPANVDPSSCPNYPYCHEDVVRQVPPVALPGSAYSFDVDPFLCPNYPFCNTRLKQESYKS